MTEIGMKRKGYEIKHSTAVGWWVDGACGYAVAAYFDTKDEAVDTALRNIDRAKKTGEHPSWYID